MTLKEKLDGKLPPLSDVIWKELEDIFLEIAPEDLSKGVTVSVYKNDINSYFCHNIESFESKVGTKFLQDFDVVTLKKVINIAKENGLKVETVSDGSHYNFIYSPTWK